MQFWCRLDDPDHRLHSVVISVADLEVKFNFPKAALKKNKPPLHPGVISFPRVTGYEKRMLRWRGCDYDLEASQVQ